MKRRQSIPVQAGKVTIGGSAPISIQTMSTVSPAHTAEAIADAKRLASYGAEILRFAVPDMEAAKGLSAVVSAVDIPIVADIHFDYRWPWLPSTARSGPAHQSGERIGAD